MIKPQIPSVPKVQLWRSEVCPRADRVLDLLAVAKAEVDVYDPVASPPSVDQMRELVAQYVGSARELALHREPLFKELELDEAGDEALLAALAANPTLLRLPIGVARGKAVIARPAEVILGLLAPQVPDDMDVRAMMRLGMSGKLPEIDTSELPLEPPNG